MVKGERRFEVGDPVLVPWGRAEPLNGQIIEVWGDPDDHVRVRVRFEWEEPMYFLVPSSWLLPAA
jgi:hypothetical protein